MGNPKSWQVVGEQGLAWGAFGWSPAQGGGRGTGLRVPTPVLSLASVGSGWAHPSTCQGALVASGDMAGWISRVSLALGGVVIIVTPRTSLAGHVVMLVAIPELV